MLICASAILLLSVFHCLPGSLAESFYELLGIDHDADLVTIRRAFKRVALVKHPDKNQDDPDAHSAFIRINRAYEVLKDEEKRRKYDQFGEEGLGDGDGGTGGAGQQYQSWHYYKENFGIYDDDPEVHTLSRADFHEEVFESGEIWFVNFFSAHCSHCHQLAPAWRELARQVPEGVAQIGAVNCAEDPGLCQSQQVTHYPSLLLYPRLEWFQGAREIASLLQFLLSRLPAPVLRPTEVIALPIKRPLLVEHCPTGASEDDCLSEEDRQKVAAIAFKLGIDFALFDCTSGIAASEAETICQTIGHNSGLFVLQEGHPSPKELFFADMADLRSQLLAELPPLPELDEAELEWLIHRPPDGENNEAVLGLLVGDQQQMEAAEWRLLGQLAGLQARLVPCHRLSDICANLQQTGRLPRPVLFRPQGGYDIHYGNNVQIRDVAKFIRRSTSSTLVVLDSEKYWEARNSGDLWLIDHFAPWCPPCLRLLNELRKLPATVEGGKQQLRVGSLDCEANREICQQEGVNSYPRTMLFTEDGGQHTLVGYHPVEELLEFITETIHPSVQQLDSVAFKEKIHARPAGSLFFVDFFAPWCGPCQQLAPEFRRLARQWAVANPDSQIGFGSVDCDQNGQLCDREGVRSYPTLRLYRHSDDFAPIDYPQNWWRNSQTMAHWLAEMQPSLVAKLAGDFANTVLDSTKPFLVDFYAPWCSHCIQFAPTFERLAKLLEGQIHLGKVDCERFGWICQSAGIKAFPSVALFAGAVGKGQRQSPLDWMPVQHGRDAEKIAQQVRELVAARRNSISRDEL